jgi:hypothetical protein
VLLRTTEVHRQHGEPSYNGMLVFGLSPEKFGALSAELERTGATRLTATRLADLLPSGVVEGRGLGRNVLAFQVGDWTHVIPMGLQAGKDAVEESLVADIETRLQVNPYFDLDEVHLAGPRAVAQRFLAWAASRSGVGFSGLQVGPWIDRVRNLAHMLEGRDPVEQRSQAAQAVLAWVLGDAGLAAGVARDGLRALRAGAVPLDSAARLLMHSLGGPATDAQSRLDAQGWPGWWAEGPGGVDTLPPLGTA